MKVEQIEVIKHLKKQWKYFVPLLLFVLFSVITLAIAIFFANS